MELQSTSRQLFRGAGLLVWLSAGVVFPACARDWRFIPPTLAAYLLFAAGFLRLTSPRQVSTGAARLGLLGLQSVSAAILILLHPYYMAANLIVVVGWQAALILPPKRAALWILTQTLVSAPVLVAQFGAAFAWPYLVAVIAFQLFGLITAQVARKEAAARRVLIEAEGQLAEATRMAERLHLARELHDVVGHELTGLRVQLELAKRTLPAGQRHSVEAAHASAGRLLDRVREVVSATREPEPIDLRGLLETLQAATEDVAITLHLDEDLRSLPPQLLLTLVRLAQEAVTNTRRHGLARTLFIKIERCGDRLQLRIEDDGRGVAAIVPGNGLRGMRERIENLGGKIVFQSGAGRGFLIDSSVPLPATAR